MITPVQPEGAFTGEICTGMLVEVGCTGVIIGHSERRQYFNETDASVLVKTKAALEAGLTPIVCVGEVLSEREAKELLSFLSRQHVLEIGPSSAFDLLVDVSHSTLANNNEILPRFDRIEMIGNSELGEDIRRLLAASDLGLAGAIGLYGLPGMVYGVLDQLTAPIQIHVAGADMVSPVHAFEALARHLEDRRKAFEMYVYDGAPHAYFDEHYADWAQACQQTWEAMLGFADGVTPARAG